MISRLKALLAAAIGPYLWITVGVAALTVIGGVGLYGHGRYEAGLKAGAESERKVQAKIAAKEVKKQDRITVQADKAAVKAQTKIEIRYRTLREKVSIYVPLHTPAGVISAADLVPASTVLLLDAAVRGDEPDAISVAGGRTYETASPFRFDQLVDNYVVNLKVGHSNSQSLSDLQGWVTKQRSADHHAGSPAP